MRVTIGRVHEDQRHRGGRHAAIPRWYRTVGIILALGLLVVPLCAEAQRPPKVPRVGYLSRSPDAPVLEPFQQKLRELGWIEGQNIAMEYRWTEGRTERLPALVAELIRLNVDVIYTQGSNAAAHVAKQATTTIPIVFTTPADPLATGLVSSLARPGGNVTGLGGGVQAPIRRSASRSPRCSSSRRTRSSNRRGQRNCEGSWNGQKGVQSWCQQRGVGSFRVGIELRRAQL